MAFYLSLSARRDYARNVPQCFCQTSGWVQLPQVKLNITMNIIRKIKDISRYLFTRMWNRQFLVFLFFLALSTSFWFSRP